MDRPDLKAWHRHAMHNEEELAQSTQCGCFACGATFAPREITAWIDAGKPWRPAPRTALCPRCQMDAVIGSASGFPLTAEMLEEMRRHWLGGEE